jgi:hypothetical protein
VIPSTVVFVADDADPDLFQLPLSDPDSCRMFNRRRRLMKSIDFQRTLRFASGLPRFKDFVFDLSGFEERSVIGRSQRVSRQIYLRRWVENLRHPMIAPLIDSVFPVKSSGKPGYSLAHILSWPPEGKVGRGNCAWASVCAWHWTAASGGDGEQYAFRC